jgi:nitrogen regulatory protein P-II 1
MKKIEAIFEPFKLDEVKEALERKNIHRMTIFEVKGAGSKQGKIKQYRGAPYIEDAHEVKIEIIADDDEVCQLADTIVNTLRTGYLCDGEVVILPVDRVGRVRMGKFSQGIPIFR